VDRRSVRRWRAAYETEGVAGVAARPAPGRPPKLTARQIRQLAGHLLDGAQASGFSSDLWTCPRVRVVIRRRFGVRYHVDHIGRLLRSMGFSPQKPERRARKRDEAGIRRWVRKDWRRIKKKPRG
jgi:transposase